MIVINFTEDDIQALRVLQEHQHNFIRRKALTLLLKSYGIAHNKIAKIVGISENSMRQYFKEYVQGGISSIKAINFNTPMSSLEPFKDKILTYLNQSPPTSIKQACEEIGAITGIKLKESAMRAYLKSIGVKCRKVCGIPSKADPIKQKHFLENELQPRLDEAEAGKRDVFFFDSAHFVLGAFLGFVWSLVRVFVKVPSGRQRFNVLGALNAVTKELITVANDTYITAKQVCNLLDIIAQNGMRKKTVVLDNARYQRCNLVIEHAAKLNIELLFLPPYSPNLNLIERVWKFTKKKCLNSKYYATFDLFKNAIGSFLAGMHKEHEVELKSLLTLKFQVFTEEQLRQAV